MFHRIGFLALAAALLAAAPSQADTVYRLDDKQTERLRDMLEQMNPAGPTAPVERNRTREDCRDSGKQTWYPIESSNIVFSCSCVIETCWTCWDERIDGVVRERCDNRQSRCKQGSKECTLRITE